MATHEPSVERLYDPEELRPGAPRLYVWRNDNDWQLLDEEGTVLSIHPSQADAIDAALVRSRVRYTEILVRGSTGRVEWLVHQGCPPRGCDAHPRRGRHRRIPLWRNLRLDAGLRRLPAHRRLAGGRDRSVELFYDPGMLDPDAPRLHVIKNGGGWELRDGHAALLAHHPSLPQAIDAAVERTRTCRGEILVRGSSGRMEWSVTQNPEFVELARVLNATAAARRTVA